MDLAKQSIVAFISRCRDVDEQGVRRALRRAFEPHGAVLLRDPLESSVGAVPLHAESAVATAVLDGHVVTIAFSGDWQVMLHGNDPISRTLASILHPVAGLIGFGDFALAPFSPALRPISVSFEFVCNELQSRLGPPATAWAELAGHAWLVFTNDAEPETHYDLGVAYREMGLHLAAMAELTLAQRLAPNAPWAAQARGYITEYEKQDDE